MKKIIGKVIDESTNTPIVEAVVLLNNEDSSFTDIAQLTNEEGEFKWMDLETGRYNLQIILEGYKSKNVGVKFNGEETKNIVVSLMKV